MSLIAEQEVIAVMLASPHLAKECDLSAGEFKHAVYQDIYGGMRALVDAGETFDFVTLAMHFEQSLPEAESSHIWQAMKDLLDKAVGDKSMFAKYCTGIRESFRLTEISFIAKTLLRDIQETKDAGAADRAITQLMALERTGRSYEWTMEQAVVAGLRQIEEAAEREGLVGIDTGIPLLNDASGGFNNSDLIVIGARPAMGKAQSLNSNILLSTGQFKLMGDIRVGDSLASVDGLPSVVEAVYPQGVRPIYAVTISDGRVVECDIEHLWAVESSRFKGRKIVTTEEMVAMLESSRYQNRIRIVSHSGSFGSDNNLPMDPWLLGFLLGDGCLRGSTVRFSTSEPFILDKVKSSLPPECSINYLGKCDYRIVGTAHVNPILNAVRSMGMNVNSYDKSVPSVVGRSCRNTREGVLLGLIESDGWSQGSSLQFSSSSKVLTDDVISLVRSIGGVAKYRLKTSVHYVKDGVRISARDAHICSMAFDGMGQVIKSERVLKNLGVRKKSAQPIVQSIGYLRDDFAQCIKVSHQESLYITDGYVVTHNTALLLNMANAAKVPAGIVSAEQGNEQIGKRMLSIEGSCDAQKIRTATLDDDFTNKLSMAARRLVNKKIWINDQPAINIVQLCRQVREWVHRYGAQIAYVDYIQKIRGSSPRMNPKESTAEVVSTLKNLAKELQIPIVALAQVNREVDKRPDARPHMGDLSNAGEIEMEADLVIMLYRDEVYNSESPDKGIAELLIEKNRHGPTGRIRTAWIGRYMQFKELTHGGYD